MEIVCIICLVAVLAFSVFEFVKWYILSNKYMDALENRIEYFKNKRENQRLMLLN